MRRLRPQCMSKPSILFPLIWVWLVVFSNLGCECEEDEDYITDEFSPISEHEFPKEYIPTKPNYTGPGDWATPRPDLAAKIGFVPMKFYAQVRHTDTVKHLPRSEAIKSAVTAEEIANAPRLREVVSTKKLGEVYTEEGYEDSAYDHADFEKKQENEEGYEHDEKKVPRPRKGRHRGDDSEHQSSDIDSKYVGTTGEEIKHIENPPTKPKIKLNVSRREKHMITVENNMKRVYPSFASVAHTKTAHQPRASFHSPASPRNSLRPRNGGRSKNYFIEPDASGTSPSQLQHTRSTSQTDGGMSSENEMPTTFDVTVPATILTPPKLPSVYSASHKKHTSHLLSSNVRNFGDQSQMFLEGSTYFLPSANDIVILQPEVTRGTVNNYEKILLPQFFTTNVYDLYLGIKRNNESTGRAVLKSSNSDLNASKGSVIVSLPERSESEDVVAVNDTDVRKHEQYVSKLTMLHFGRNSTIPKESPAMPESEDLSRLTEREFVNNLTTTTETTTVSKRTRMRGTIKSRQSSTQAPIYIKNKSQPVRNKSSTRRSRLLRPPGKLGRVNVGVTLKKHPNANAGVVTASSQNVKSTESPSLYYKDLDVGMSEKKFIFAFERIFQEPMGSDEQVSKESNSLLQNANKLVVRSVENVPTTRLVRGAGVTKLSSLKLLHNTSGGKHNETSQESRKQTEVRKVEDDKSKTARSVLPSIATRIQHDSRKYPFYSKLPTNSISGNSPIRYALDTRLIPQKTESGMEFYESRENVYCPEVSPKLDVVPKRKSPGEWNKSPRPHLPRLSGLGDKIDCLRTKYFGYDPLDNPLFSESINSDTRENSENMESISKFIENIKSVQTKIVNVKQI